MIRLYYQIETLNPITNIWEHHKTVDPDYTTVIETRAGKEYLVVTNLREAEQHARSQAILIAQSLRRTRLISRRESRVMRVTGSGKTFVWSS